jgi:hypothetical protein
MNRDMHMFTKFVQQPTDRTVHAGDGELIGRIVDRELAVAEEQFTNRMLGPLQLASLQTPELLEKSAACGRRESEPLNSFFGRTGIDPRKLREWTVERLTKFAEQTARNDAEQGISEPKPAMF